MKTKEPVFLLFLCNILVISGNLQKDSNTDDWVKTQIITRSEGIKWPQVSTPGSGTYLEFISTSSLWVDKSLLIKEIWESPHSVLLISGIPRWGKSINLAMLKFYHELRFDVDKHETDSYNYFVNGKLTVDDTIYNLKKPLISDYKNNYHLAAYPVIHIKGDVLRMHLGLESFQTMILETFSSCSHYRMFLESVVNNRSSIITREDLKRFDTSCDNHKIKYLSQSSLATRIYDLSRILNNLFRKPVIILFDEYDSFIHNEFFSSEQIFDPNNEQIKTFMDVLQTFVRITFKDNPYLARAVITGVLNVHETKFLSGVNNVRFIHVFDQSDLYPFYGIFGPEFQQIAEIVKLDSFQFQNVTKYYGGYHTLSHIGTPIYSMYSLVGYITNKEIKNYWMLANLHNFIPFLLCQKEFLSEIVQLMREYGTKKSSIYINKASFPRMLLSDCKTVQELYLQKTVYCRSIHKNPVFAVLLSAGLVSIHPSYEPNPFEINLKLPNLEIWNFFRDQWITSLHIDFHDVNVASRAIIEYVSKQEDSVTLSLLLEAMAISIQRDKGSGRLGHTQPPLGIQHKTPISNLFTETILENEAVIETLVKILFQDALQYESERLDIESLISSHISSAESLKIGPQLTRRLSHMNNQRIDLIFIFKRITVIVIELKYNNSTKKESIHETLKQSLSYTTFFRGFNVSQFPYYKFLALCVDDKIRIEAMSLSLTSPQLIKMMAQSESKLEVEYSSQEKKSRLKENYVKWKDSMYDQVVQNQLLKAAIVHHLHDPNFKGVNDVVENKLLEESELRMYRRKPPSKNRPK